MANLEFGAGAYSGTTSGQTWASHGISTAAPNRYVIVCLARSSAYASATVTVNGAATTRVASRATLGDIGIAEIYITNTPVPTGVTASIAVSIVGGASAIQMATYALYDPSSATPNDTRSTQTNNASLGLSVPAGGVGLGIAFEYTPTTFTVSGGVEDIDQNSAGITGCAAHTTATGTVALAFNAASSSFGVAVGAAWAIASAVDLAADDISTGTPAIGVADLGQVHVLATDSASAGEPAVGSPALRVAYPLTAAGIDTGPSAIGQPVLGQVHDLDATDIDAGAPSLGTPAAAVADSLSATGIVTGDPTVGAPTLADVPAVVAPPRLPVQPIASGGWVGGGERGATAIYGPYEQRKPKTTRKLVREALDEPETPPEPPAPPAAPAWDRSELVRAMLAAENAMSLMADDEDDDDLLLMAA